MDELDALAPRVDEDAARRLFDRRRARARRRRGLLRGAGVAVVAVALGTGLVAVMGGGDDDRTPVVTDAGPSTTTPRVDCPGLAFVGAEPDEVRTSLARQLTGERSGPAGYEAVVGQIDGKPAVELEISWATPTCYALAVGITPEEFYDSYYLVDDEGRPMLDPRGAVWPETAQSQIAGRLPDERRSPDGVAVAFAREVLGWDDLVEEELAREPGHNGCDMTVYVRRASDPEREVPVDVSLGVGRRWASVCAPPQGGAGLHAVVEGSTITVSGAGAAFPDAAGTEVRVDYGGNVVDNHLEPGVPSDLGFVPEVTGSAIVLYRDADGEVIGYQALTLPAGDGEVGEPPRSTQDRAPVVLSQLGVLGWWTGGQWRDLVDASTDVPYAPGDRFSVVGVGEELGEATAGETFVPELCGLTIALEPSQWGSYASGPAPIAVRADWDLVPRPVEKLDPSSDAYEAVVADYLASVGIEDGPVAVRQVVRADLDGDGADEVLVTATHPELDSGSAPRAGWYSVVLLRRVVDGDVVTIPLESKTFLVDNPDDYPTQIIHDVAAVADVNGDGRMEVATYSQYFEGSSSRVFDGDDVVLTSEYCGA